ncbi:MAG: V-type ATP synthase subunit B [DPANN group archaeon]|nr:V-type ATP synthase subunit B [DPANN group archaeon]
MITMKEYSTVSKVKGPLIILKNTENVGYNEIVKIITPAGVEKLGQVLELNEDLTIIEVFEGTTGIDTDKTKVRFIGGNFKHPVSKDMVGGIFDGLGRPIDFEIIAEKEIDINGAPINPTIRDVPTEFIETKISAIDGLFSLVKGQKLPIFSEEGLPHNKLATKIAEQLDDGILVIFGAIGITNEELHYFTNEFKKAGALENIIVFANLADDPVIERVVTPRIALATAEYFAWELGRDVVVILSDITAYANGLRELSAAKEEIPGKRGYPPYLYTDLATIFERAGIIKGKKGSITQIPIITMPEGDITHPIPDLTGYITEGQIILSNALSRKGIFPPINIIPSLSRMMHNAIGTDKTREDHKQVSDQIYAAYTRGKKLEELKKIIGEDALSETDRKYLEFVKKIEETFINQKDKRTIKDTLDISWNILRILPKEDLTKIETKYIDTYWYAK